MKIEIEYNGSYAICTVDGVNFNACDSFTQARAVGGMDCVRQHWFREAKNKRNK